MWTINALLLEVITNASILELLDQFTMLSETLVVCVEIFMVCNFCGFRG